MMKCPRCQGLMVIHWCMNMENVSRSMWVEEWRCLNCGELLDEATLKNRESFRPNPNFLRRGRRKKAVSSDK